MRGELCGHRGHGLGASLCPPGLARFIVAAVHQPGTNRRQVRLANPLELTAFLEEKNVDIFVGGVKERPIAYKLGVAFCDHNHERKEMLAGFAGMLNFAREVYSSVMSPVWRFVPRKSETVQEVPHD